MKFSMKNMDSLLRKLRQRKRKAEYEQERTAVVFYTAPHAVAVHEDYPIDRRPTNFKVGGPKFLEAPAREMMHELAVIVNDALGKGYTLAEGLIRAAKALRIESQSRCPVDTGELRDSAGERLEE